MQLRVRVKTGTHRDGLWRDGRDLLVHLRDETTGTKHAHLIRYLSGSLRLAPSLIAIKRERPIFLATIKAQPADLEPILESLPFPPASGLFDDQPIL